MSTTVRRAHAVAQKEAKDLYDYPLMVGGRKDVKERQAAIDGIVGNIQKSEMLPYGVKSVAREFSFIYTRSLDSNNDGKFDSGSFHGLDSKIYITPAFNWDQYGNLDHDYLLDTILHEIQHGQRVSYQHGALFDEIVNDNVGIYNKEFGN